MIALNIQDQKQFMSALLTGSQFHSFYLSKAVIATGTTMTLEGRLNPDFYNTGALTLPDGTTRTYALWSETQETCYLRIKGKKLPLSFQITLLLPAPFVPRLLEDAGVTTVTPEQIEGLFLNIRFDRKQLSCVTGTSLRAFTLDKSVEQAWDRWVEGFIRKLGIAAEK